MSSDAYTFLEMYISGFTLAFFSRHAGRLFMVQDYSWHTMDFPEDLLIEVLLHFPVKSLLIWWSGCKSWYALIKSPNFIAVHLSRAKNSKLLLIRLRHVPSHWKPPYLTVYPSNPGVKSMTSPQLIYSTYHFPIMAIMLTSYATATAWFTSGIWITCTYIILQCRKSGFFLLRPAGEKSPHKY